MRRAPLALPVLAPPGRLIAASLFTLCIAFASVATHAQPHETLDAWPRLQSLLDLRQATDPPGQSHPTAATRGRFEQRRTSLLLREPLISEGTFAVLPGLARFDTLTPNPARLLVEPDAVSLYDPATGTTERHPRDPDAPPDPANDLVGLLLAGQTATLRDAFAAAAHPLESDDAQAFILQPRRDDGTLPTVRLELGNLRGEPRQLRIDQPDGDTLELRFFDMERDASLTADALRADFLNPATPP